VNLRRILAAEFLGTLLLLAVVVGSGIMGEKLAAGNLAVALLGNSLATGCGLLVLIVIFGPVSGAHFNPLVSAMAFSQQQFGARELASRGGVQLAGALVGVWLAHAMFGLPLFQQSHHLRNGAGQWLGEFVATAGLMLTILGSARTLPQWTPPLVATYITGAYWFTSSTSFANPAVTLARALTDSFAGIAPGSVTGFIAAQAAGALAGVLFADWMWPRARTE
jgi:glycerol uptake facilitator-like aquaporin